MYKIDVFRGFEHWADFTMIFVSTQIDLPKSLEKLANLMQINCLLLIGSYQLTPLLIGYNWFIYHVIRLLLFAYILMSFFFFSEQILIEIQNKYSSWSKVIEEISGPKVSMRCNELISWIFALGKLLLHCQIRAYNPEKKNLYFTFWHE